MKKVKSKRKSICFLTHDLITGGLENVLIEALNILHNEYDIDVICLYGETEKELLKSFPTNVNVIIQPFYGSNILNKIISRFKYKLYLSKFYFSKIIKRRYDFIIGLKSLERFACFSGRGKHYIYWCHNDWHTKLMEPELTKTMKKEKKLIKALYKKHNMVWTVNETIANELRNIFPSDNFYSLPNPINCNEIIKKSEEPSDIVFDKTKTNIVLLGRISSEKGFGRVVRVMSEDIFEKFPNTHLYIIGEGPAKEYYERKINELGLCDKVTLLGSKANPYPILKQADLLISPSKFESFGLVMMEAMLLNVPVIATSTTGAKYVTQNGKYAQCVENNNSSLHDAIYKFLENPNSYNFPKEEAKKWVWEHDTDLFASRLKELLRKCEDI